MRTYQQLVSKVVGVIMTASTILAALIPSAAHAASTYSSTVSTATVGTAITPTLSYTVDTAVQTWANADTLTFQLPANMPQWGSLTYTVEYDTDTINNATGETQIAAGVANGEYSVSTDTLTVKWNATGWGAPVNGASTVRVIITAGMTPQYANATSNITFAGTTVAADTNPSGTATINVSASDAAATLTLGANSVVGTAGSMTLQLTTPIDLVNGSTILFTAPSNLDVSGVTFSSETFGGAGSFSACTAAYQVVTCTSSGAHTAGTATIVMTGVRSWFEAFTQTIGSVSVKDASANTQASDSSGTVTDTAAGSLTSAALSFSTNIAEAVGSVTISLSATVTSTLGIPNAGRILVVFPAGYTISGASGRTASSLSGVDGTWTAAVLGQQLLLIQSAGTTSTAGAKSLVIGGIKNPPARNSSGTFAVSTETAEASRIQAATAEAVTVINISFGSAPQPQPESTTDVPAPTPNPVVVAPSPVVVVPEVPVVAPAPIAEKSRKESLDQLRKGKFDREVALKSVVSISEDLTLTTSDAAKCTSDSLIKLAGNSAVYYCGADGKRYVFPNSQIFKSWFGDFKDVQTITPEQMAALQLGGNVKYRPGVTMIKLQTDPRVYVVAPGGVLRWVNSETVAAKHYGADWNKKVQDISDAFFGNYSFGEPIVE